MEIDVNDVNMVELIKKAYDLSSPQGLGILHFQNGTLTDEEAKSCISKEGMINMDYVKGRACKFGVFRSLETNRLVIHSPWYDHTDEQLIELLSHVGITYEGGEGHNICCNCDFCLEQNRGNPL
jgi:hypothetical protein